MKINGHTGATFENINSEASLNSYNISFRVKDDDGSEHSTTLSAEGLTTTSISFGVSSDDGAPTQYGSLTCNSSTLVASFSTIQSEANIQLYKRGSSIPAFYVYDGTTNWGGQTLGWDGSKEVATLDANTQAVPFIYGIELVKNAQGYVTDVKLKQHGLRFIGGILV